MVYDPIKNQSGKAGLVIQYEKLPDHLRSTHDWPQRYGLGTQPEYIPTMVFTPAALALARVNLGPRWPLSDPELEPAVVCCLPAEEERLTTGYVPEVHNFVGDLCHVLGISTDHTYAEILGKVAGLRKVAEPPEASEEQVRVLRVVEYVGPRKLVERQVKMSLHGTRGGLKHLPGEGVRFPSDSDYGPAHIAPVQITAVTLGEYPEVLEQAKKPATAPAAPRIVSVADAFEEAGCLCTIGQPINEACPIHGSVNIMEHRSPLDTPPDAMPQSPAPAPALDLDTLTLEHATPVSESTKSAAAEAPDGTAAPDSDIPF